MSQEIGRFAPDEAMRRFEAALVAAHDRLRPLGRYVVTDNSEWSEVGASFVRCRIGGAQKRVVYRDGPLPAVGSLLQCVRMRDAATAPWLALPQAAPPPPPPAPFFVYSAPSRPGTRNVSAGLVATAAGSGWQEPGFDDSAWLSPVAGNGLSPLPHGDMVYPGTPNDVTYIRQPFAVPAGATHATITLYTEGSGLLGAWLNGVAHPLGGVAGQNWQGQAGAALLPGQTNLLAFTAQGPAVVYVVDRGVGVAYQIEGG